jgi:hypothetical protein
MIKTFFFLICSSAALRAQGQTVTYSIGTNYTTFLSSNELSNISGTYTPQLGNLLEINFKDIPFSKYTVGFGFLAERYTGSFEVLSSGLGGSSQTEATVTKNVVGLTFYPLNLNWRQKWHFQLGGLMNYLLAYNFVGSRQNTLAGMTLRSALHLPADRNYNIGVITSLSYSWEFKKNWLLVPKYSFYGSFMDDFVNLLPENRQTLKHYFSMGISKRLN